jgi:hypothetical protein
VKLIAVMSIHEYADELRRLFREHRVPVFSETDIQGYNLHADPPENSNWFADRHVPVYSHLIFAFTEAGKADELMEAIRKRSSELDPKNPIRAFQLHVEKQL